jgi:hypothetical protein
MTILVILLGIGVLYFLLDKMSKLSSDTRLRNLSDYLLIFRQGLEILYARRWLVLIAFVTALFALLFKFVFGLARISSLGKPYPFWDDFFFSGIVKSLDPILFQIKHYIIYTTVNAFFFVGPYNVLFCFIYQSRMRLHFF